MTNASPTDDEAFFTFFFFFLRFRFFHCSSGENPSSRHKRVFYGCLRFLCCAVHGFFFLGCHREHYPKVAIVLPWHPAHIGGRPDRPGQYGHWCPPQRWKVLLTMISPIEGFPPLPLAPCVATILTPLSNLSSLQLPMGPLL